MALHGRECGLIEIHHGICLEGFRKTTNIITITDDLAKIRNRLSPVNKLQLPLTTTTSFGVYTVPESINTLRTGDADLRF